MGMPFFYGHPVQDGLFVLKMAIRFRMPFSIFSHNQLHFKLAFGVFVRKKQLRFPGALFF